ncbi:MAG: FAD-dependent oxidoreductase, partial [Ilumatobacter sp.]|nr:FAD-dependent oxidoreductase [Ilumatobacter sp.]
MGGRGPQHVAVPVEVLPEPPWRLTGGHRPPSTVGAEHHVRRRRHDVRVAPCPPRGSLPPVATRFVIIGGGPAGNTAATHAARLGAEVTLIERDVIGGAAHLWDCIPSKTMIATGGAMSFTRRMRGMGLEQQQAELDVDALTERIDHIKGHLQASVTGLLSSQGVRMLSGTARLVGPHEVEVTSGGVTTNIPADAVLVATGSSPRIPEWCQPDGERILTTRDCYPPKIFPSSITVVGSGVTGVEFVHMFS